MITLLNSQPLLLVAGLIALGYAVGQIKIKGFALESSAILFAALIAGHYGLQIPDLFRNLGLAFFIYSIGLQAGPRFSAFFKKEGLALNLMAFLIVAFGALLTMIGVWLFGFGKEISIGIFTGALTSTPGLAAAVEASGSGQSSIGYGIAYPMGVIGVMIFIKFLPMMMRVKVKDVEQQEQEALKQDQLPVVSRHIEVTNPNVCGKTLKMINLSSMAGVVISRLARGSGVEIPNGASVLQKNDILRVVGAEDKIPGAVMILGELSDQEIPAGNLDLGRFAITNRKLLGKRIQEIGPMIKYSANITRVGRSGMDLPVNPAMKLEWGDRVSVVAEKQDMEQLKEFFGDDIKKAEEGNVFSIIAGIALGILIGMIPFAIGKVISFNLGVTGGVLLSAIFLSNRGHFGPIVWRVPYNIINFIRELGLVLFLCSVGADAGKTFISVIRQNGITLFIFGAFITLLPMFFILFFAVRKYQSSILHLFGLIPGGMTSTPGFAAATALTASETPAAIYAAVYPVAMLSMIIFSKIMAALPHTLIR